MKQKLIYHIILLSSLVMSLSLKIKAQDNYQFEFIYKADYFNNLEGGIKQSDAYLDNLDILFDLDSEAAWQIKDSQFHFHLLYNNNNTFSDLVGDAQGVSNIDNSHVVRLYELWFEKKFTAHSLKFGLYDLNSEFDSIEPAGLFINSSHGIGPDFSQSGENGPSIFPTTSLGIRYQYSFDPKLIFQIAILDAVPGDPSNPRSNRIKLGGKEGALFVFETNFLNNITKYGLGSWRYSQKSQTLDGLAEKNNAGLYSFIENHWTTQNNLEIAQWIRFGLAEQKINQIKQYIGLGFTLSHFSIKMPDDQFGFSIARASHSSHYLNYNPGIATHESVFEVTYKHLFNSLITLQPDIQYIINPSSQAAIDNALVVGLRMEINW